MGPDLNIAYASLKDSVKASLTSFALLVQLVVRWGEAGLSAVSI